MVRHGLRLLVDHAPHVEHGIVRVYPNTNWGPDLYHHPHRTVVADDVEGSVEAENVGMNTVGENVGMNEVWRECMKVINFVRLNLVTREFSQIYQ